MVELYRASAGSGKTYTLAKKYIWYLITISEDGGKPRLRTDAELADSAKHILAVTFTNKATNEMQMRIVDALFSLAYSPVKHQTNDFGETTISSPEYMRDFTDELNVAPDEIAAISAKALYLLLENYSDFNVSTIDSFFQQVLRTFAYESQINDTYQVELDSDYLSKIAVDATLDEIDSNSDDANVRFWVKVLMDRTLSGKWNIFSKSDSKYSTSENPYSDFISSVKRLENEEYKFIRKEVEQYLDSGVDLKRLFVDLVNKYESPIRVAFEDMRAAFKSLKDVLPEELLNASSRSDLGKFAMNCNRVLDTGKGAFKFDNLPKANGITLSLDIFEKSTVKKWFSNNPVFEAPIIAAVKTAIIEKDNWLNMLRTKEYALWKLYSANFPFFALFSIVARNKQKYLEETNSIELGETSMIISGIIGDSDAPFIYERLGSRLNHFLIDEFQDTSRLQWQNLSPLLHESVSHDNGNLVIGDAKQSIYRFRNADPSLITSVLPQEFGSQVQPKGDKPEENTNYRSELHIVQFNNSFFEYLVSRIDSQSDNSRLKFAPLYSNVVQQPNKKKKTGYVELTLADAAKSEFENYVLSKMPHLVMSLVERGYLQKEIAVVVREHSQGEAVIKAFVEYNAMLDDESRKIRFVSEQSLKLANSEAVKIIEGVLLNMARGSKPELREEEDRLKKGVGNWAELMANFKYYAMSREGDSIADVLNDYIREGADFNALSDLLRDLQSLAIPAIVEAVAATFIPESLRKSDAVYIASFQDIVLEYCDGHPTDIGSFLKWWERKKKSVSISSPEDTDAVQVITVHKSKGLQYECVIVPFAYWDFADGENRRAEWKWVRPQMICHTEIPMPPYLPVATSNQMIDTPHENELYNFYDLVKMDHLNAAYVAFTRAKSELYIFSVGAGANKLTEENNNRRSASSTSIGSYLFEFMDRFSTGDMILPTDISHLDRVDVYKESKGISKFYVGEKSDNVGENRKLSSPSILIDTYKSVKSPTFLKYVPQDMPKYENIQESEKKEDYTPFPDVRSEGNMKHAVLEFVMTPNDLPAAVRHLSLKGVIPQSWAQLIEEDLKKALQLPDVARWFDGTARVVTERSLLKKGAKMLRPDRLMIYPDGSVVVVDYKFGEVPTGNVHKNQVKSYMSRLAETGKYTKICGYVWYVNESKVVPV